MDNSFIQKQQQICNQFKVPFTPVMDGEIIGVAIDSINDKNLELNGLRHPPQGKTAGWYIWRGEFQETEDFFKPMHVQHLLAVAPEAIKFLGLPPGWRFLKKYTYEDIWYDPALLNIADENE